MVLAALVHVLACAHGPELGRDAGSDSLPVAAAVASAEPAADVVSVSAAREQGLRFADCTGVDDPSVLSRDLGAPSVPEALAPAGAVERAVCAVAGRAAPAEGSPGDRGDQQRVRSLLGVWRS